jgi:hypothetical protein
MQEGMTPRDGNLSKDESLDSIAPPTIENNQPKPKVRRDPVKRESKIWMDILNFPSKGKSQHESGLTLVGKNPSLM